MSSNWRFLVFVSLIIYYIQWATPRTTFFLVCLYKVFQRTLFFCRFRFIGKAFAKVRGIFQSTKFFQKYFWKNFPSEPRWQFLALLFVYKIRYSLPFRPFSECHLYSRSLSKADAKVRTFFVSASIWGDFFEENLSFFVNGL